jgi:hypothetical protein
MGLEEAAQLGGEQIPLPHELGDLSLDLRKLAVRLLQQSLRIQLPLPDDQLRLALGVGLDPGP